MINKEQAKWFCAEDISLIENYEQAVNDKSRTWDVHHRAEILPCGIYTVKNLKDHGLYYKQPAARLVFMTRTQHASLHGRNMSETTKRKMSQIRKGRPRSEETKRKISESKRKPVQQFSKDGRFIKEWSSAREAAEHIDKTDKFLSKKINRCCHGGTRTSRGFVWKYA